MMSVHRYESIFKPLAKFTILAFFSIWSFGLLFPLNAAAAQWVKTIQKQSTNTDGTVVLKDVRRNNGHDRQKLDLLVPMSEEKPR